jgi:hypothetical protein
MDTSLHVLCPAPLADAVKRAASNEMTSTSEFVRRTLLQRLRADGIIDLQQFAPARSSAA